MDLSSPTGYSYPNPTKFQLKFVSYRLYSLLIVLTNSKLDLCIELVPVGPNDAGFGILQTNTCDTGKNEQMWLIIEDANSGSNPVKGF
jgi:hypothetical protein